LIGLLVKTITANIINKTREVLGRTHVQPTLWTLHSHCFSYFLCELHCFVALFGRCLGILGNLDAPIKDLCVELRLQFLALLERPFPVLIPRPLVNADTTSHDV